MKFLIYIVACFLIGGLFKWYDLVWVNSSVTYLHWVIISFFSVYFIANSQKSESAFKSLWQTVMSLIFIATIVTQSLIWLGYADYGVFKK